MYVGNSRMHNANVAGRGQLRHLTIFDREHRSKVVKEAFLLFLLFLLDLQYTFQTRPNEIGSMTEKKDHKRAIPDHKRPYKIMQGHARP